MDWKTAIELIRAVAQLWPFALIWLGWHFRKEIAELIGRILKVEAFGAKLEADPKKNLEIAKAAAGDEKKSELETRQLIEKAADEITSADVQSLFKIAIT